jgi:hypothetical protein
LYIEVTSFATIQTMPLDAFRFFTMPYTFWFHITLRAIL